MRFIFIGLILAGCCKCPDLTKDEQFKSDCKKIANELNGKVQVFLNTTDGRVCYVYRPGDESHDFFEHEVDAISKFLSFRGKK